MFRALNKLFGVFFVIVLCRGSEIRKPVISPGQPDIYMDEGDDLTLICSGSNKIAFYYPEDVRDTISTSPAHLDEYDSGSEHKVIFRRNNTVHGDTGWYGCANEGVEVNVDIHDQPDVSWTYVWVKSNSSYFVQSDNLQSIQVTVNGTAIIPCRPTSPIYNVTFFYDHDIKMELDTHVVYNPKRGLELQGVPLKKGGYYKCQIEDSSGSSQELNYHLHVLKRQVLKDPTIAAQPLRYVTRGQTLRVNCTVIVESDSPYSMYWTTPQQDTRIMQKNYREPLRNNLQTASCELIIKNISQSDEGEYKCTVTTFSQTNMVKTSIKVHDPDVKYINLTSSDDSSYYQRNDRDRIQWMVHIDAYPQPTLKWLNPEGKVIEASWINPESAKYAINITSSIAVLRINQLELQDMGLYSLQATNTDLTKTLNFTLDVIAKPIPVLDKTKAFYVPKQKANFRCEVAAFPAPDVSWNFSRAPNYPSVEGLEVIPLKAGQIIPKVSTFVSETWMEMEMSGYLTCTACNRLGCDSDTNVILVSDVPGGFGIMEEIPQTLGDDVVRTCAASVYNYTGAEWLDEDDNLIEETGRISISKTMTNFTYQSILRISNISKADNNSYFVCSAKNDEGFIERYDYKLEIQEPVAPYFSETNMNKTEVTFDLSTEGHKTVILKCYVEGVPEPHVTWYKDDMKIKADEQYMCLHRDQELHIKYLLDENNGKYTCRVNNRFGEDENYQIIVIKAKEVSKSLIISLSVLVVICIILMIYFLIRMHHEKVIRKQLMEAGLTHFEEGALECLNPDLTVDDQAELLPYDKKWEFPREKLKFGKQLGFGAFGVVMKADAHGICEDEAVSTVAVKMVRRSTEPTYIRALASELKIMVHLGKHLNVVNLLGACTKNIAKRELLVIVEYCRFGNLHNYLLRHRGDFINQIDPASDKFDPSIGLEILTRTTSIGSNNSRVKYAALLFSRSGSTVSYNNNPSPKLLTYSSVTDSLSISASPDGCVLSTDSTQPGWRSNYHGDYKDQNLKPICTQDLLSWAFQVARGMEYLSQRKVLHGDLAARNILLAENNIVKICDFGLAKTMYKDDNYKKKGDAPLPIKWMAIESIRDRVFSTQSDIWSFGIVLWEFFTLAKTPYPGMEAEKQYQRLIEGYRMEKPEYATDQVYNIMLQCWKAKPSLRPTFTSLVSSIGELLEESVKEHYVDLNAPYLDMNTTILESGKDDYLTMMSAPDHNTLCSQNRDYVNTTHASSDLRQENSYLPMSLSSEGGESGIFGPRELSGKDEFEFRTANIDTESESEAVELSPMLEHEEDPYLKPINVRKRRAEFVKQCHEMNTDMELRKNNKIESGYCNTLQNIGAVNPEDTQLNDHDIDGSRINDTNNLAKDSNRYAPSIIRTMDNYVNMPRQKNDLRKDDATSFSNPSYIAIDNSR